MSKAKPTPRCCLCKRPAVAGMVTCASCHRKPYYSQSERQTIGLARARRLMGGDAAEQART